MSVLEIQRFAVETAVNSGKSFRIESDGTIVFDVQGKPAKLTKITKKQIKTTNGSEETIYCTVSSINGQERLTVVDILKAAAKVGKSIKIKSSYKTVWSAMKKNDMTGKIVVMSRGIVKFSRTK